MKKKFRIDFLAMVAAGIFLMLCAGNSYAANPGNALQFNGSNYVQLLPSYLGINFPGSNDFTISMWFKGNGALYNQDSGAIGNLELILTAPATSGGNIGFYASKNNSGWDPGNFASIKTVDTTVWNHVALTKSGSTVSLYINGQFDKQSTLTTSLTALAASGNLYLGYSTDGFGYFTGQIDDVQIWNTALSATAIKDNMYFPRVGNEANLQAYYKFDQAGGTTLTDYTANNYHGTLKPTGGEPTWTTSGAMTPTALSATNVTPTGFTANWNAVGGAASYQIDVSTDPAFGSFDTITAGSGTSYAVSGLAPGRTYYYRVRAVNSAGLTSGYSAAQAVSVPPLPALPAALTIVSISDVTATTGLVSGTASGDNIGERGFYWWIPPSDATHFGGSESGLLPSGTYGAGDFSLNITGLRPGNTYHVKAYVKVGNQIITSDEQLFTTATTGATGKIAPTVLTDTVNYTVSGNSITVNGEITDVGSTPVNVYGFIYAPHTAPFTGHEMPKTGDTAYAMWDKAPVYQGMKFTATVKNIPPGKWYLRAYAHNTNPDSDAAQTASLGYGADISFTIPCTPETCIPGDVNGDGKVDLADAMPVLRILAGIPVQNINLNADVNGDGKIGLEELGYILQKVAELR